MIEPTINLPEREQRLRAVMAEYHSRAAAGSSPALDVLISQHPEFALELKDLFAARRGATEATRSMVADYAATEAHVDRAPEVQFRQQSAGGVFGDYELLEAIARGGMGVVYKARQRRLDRLVALKMILAGALASQDDIERFLFEAQAAARLHHPNIVAIHEVGEHEGQHYFSMEYIAGTTLAGLLREGPLSPERAARYVQLIAEATHYAHQHGILHRDLKPANVLIDQHDQPRITDFGLAKQMDAGPELTGTGQILGTASYMAPEQCRGKQRGQACGPASDVYALGAILYACLSGRPPFQAANSIETLMQVLHQEPVSLRQYNARLPRDLETIAHKCLEKDPQRRYPSAAALAEDLLRFQDDEPIVARPVSMPVRAWKWSRRRPAAAALLALSIFSTLAVLGVLAASNALIQHKQHETEQALERESQALTERTEAFDLEKRARDDAERASDAARRESELALATLRSVIYEIDFKLRDVPAQHPLRRKLLDTAMQGLQKIGADLAGDARVDSGQLRAHLELGKLFYSIGNSDGLGGLEKARTELDTARGIGQKLAATHPGDPQIQRDLAECDFQLGNLLIDQGDVPGALKAGEASLAVRQRLCEADPQNADIQIELATSLGLLSNIMRFQGNLAVSHQQLMQGLAICRRLVEAHPKDIKYRRLLATAWLSEGNLCEREHDWVGARKAYEEAIAISRDFAAAVDDSESQQVIADSHVALGVIYDTVGDMVAARKELEKGLQIQRRLVDADPQRFQPNTNLAHNYKILGQVTQRGGDLTAARKYREQALEVAQRMAEADPNDLSAQARLAAYCNDLGDVLCRQSQYAAAREHLERSYVICGRLVEAVPQNLDYKTLLADACQAIGNTGRQRGELAEARRYLQQGLEINRGLADTDPKSLEHLRQISVFCHHLCAVAEAEGDLATAMKFNDEDSAISARLAEIEPTNAVAQNDLAVGHLNRANLYWEATSYAEAIGEFRAAAAILERMIAAGMQVEVSRKQIQEIQADLIQLAEAQQAFANREFIDQAPEKDRPRLLYERAVALSVADNMIEANATADLLRGFQPISAKTLYGAACAYGRCAAPLAGARTQRPLIAEEKEARREFIHKALEALNEAQKLGYSNVTHVKKDLDLTALHGLTEFDAIVKQMEQKPEPAKKEAKKETKKP